MDKKNISRADYVYEHLRSGIRTGTFRPGYRLREIDLATKLDVSRTPIREAIRRLASEGLLEVAPSRGVMIIEFDRQQVRELYTLRESLEGTAARLAARYASESEIAELRDLLDRLSKAGQKAKTIATLNHSFHQTIYDAARNRYLSRALDQLSDYLALLPGTTFEVPGRPDIAHGEHVAILDAIQARDPDKAEAVARSHIAMAGQARMRMMFENR